MTPNKKAEKPEKKEPETKEPSKPLIIAVIVFLVLIIISLLLWISVIHKEKKTPETPETTREPEPSFVPSRHRLYTFDPFFVTLSSSTQEKVFLKIGISAGLSSTELQLEIENKLPVLRRSMFQLLSSKTEKEINDLDGKDRLKKEITANLNQMLSKGVVKDVYFSQFVIK
jgi:flagellar protein FliL